MKISYQNIELHKSSKAWELYQLWKKSGKPEDKKALDQHMKEVAQKERELLERYK